MAAPVHPAGVVLHGYRYAWKERAKTVGYPERFAQEALGHNSKAVYRAYAIHNLNLLRELHGTIGVGFNNVLGSENVNLILNRQLDNAHLAESQNQCCL